MSAIGKGDWVECIHAQPGVRGGVLRHGAVYCVDAVIEGVGSCTHTAAIGITLTDPETKSWAPITGAEDAWSLDRFRPLRKPDPIAAPPARVAEAA